LPFQNIKCYSVSYSIWNMLKGNCACKNFFAFLMWFDLLKLYLSWRVWNENSVAKKFSHQAAALYRTAFTLSTRMLNAIQNLEYYMMIEVIEPSWHVFLQNMSKVENVDEVLAFHQDFLDSCLKNCLLTDTLQLNRTIFDMCKSCLNFCDFITVSIYWSLYLSLSWLSFTVNICVFVYILKTSQKYFFDAELKSMLIEDGDEISLSHNEDSPKKV